MGATHPPGGLPSAIGGLKERNHRPQLTITELVNGSALGMFCVSPVYTSLANWRTGNRSNKVAVLLLLLHCVYIWNVDFFHVWIEGALSQETIRYRLTWKE